MRGDEVVVIRPRGRDSLALPKGRIDAGESTTDAATREVREETGVEADLVAKLGDVRYWYRRDGRLIAKIVSFYLFAYRSGDTADHDHEVDEARWMPLAQAARELSYEGERDMVERARARIAGAPIGQADR